MPRSIPLCVKNALAVHNKCKLKRAKVKMLFLFRLLARKCAAGSNAVPQVCMRDACITAQATAAQRLAASSA
jgi:hypothetical protein